MCGSKVLCSSRSGPVTSAMVHLLRSEPIAELMVRLALRISLRELLGYRFADFRHLVAKLGDQIVEGHDTQSGIEAIDDRYAPDVIGMHQCCQMVQLFIDRDADRVRRHDPFDRR